MMSLRSIQQEGQQIILHTEGIVCSTTQELLDSEAFERILTLYLQALQKQDSPNLEALGRDFPGQALVLFRSLANKTLAEATKTIPGAEAYLGKTRELHQFIEGFYDFWRKFDRFMVNHSEHGPDSHDKRPYETFNSTMEQLTHMVRALYRDVRENIIRDHPRVYRQVSAGCDVGVIAVQRPWTPPAEYAETLKGIPFIRQVLVNPPMIIDPPMNKRTGQFQRVPENPLAGLSIKKEEWLCFPAQVGPLVIFVYFHQRFMGLGLSMANLFEVATDEQITKGPDAVYMYGLPGAALARFGDLPTVFFDDEKNKLLVGAVPGEDRFGYFGYIKKMVLTLHNIVMMKRGRMPFHGAMARITLKQRTAQVLLMGDTAAGKSETLEAFRVLGRGLLRDVTIIADDMGSLEVGPDGRVRGYGTEIGAFVRLDDLQTGYAFSQIDRAIIMSPQKVNARVVLPVTTLDEVLQGYPVDYMLYANNYEQVEAAHPILDPFKSAEKALDVFREGSAMAKGTTTSTGLVHSYFANIFGPAQYRELHEGLAEKIFRAAFASGAFVGQMRTRLGIPGFESKGPEEAAKALLELIASKK